MNFFSHTSPRRTPAPRHGFTLMEMLVSMIIASIMFGLMYIIFNTVTEGVSRGIQVSNVIQASRAVTQQFNDDFEQMLAPGDPAVPVPGTGFLVILQHLDNNTNNLMPDPQSDNNSLSIPEVIRRDQISFIRKAFNGETGARLRPQSPLSEDDFSNKVRANHARVWYGHVDRATNPQDSPLRWILGRQALLLAAWNTDYATTGPNPPNPFNDPLPANSRYAGNGTTVALPHDDVAIQSAFSGTPVLSDGFTDLFMLIGTAADFGITATDPHPNNIPLSLITGPAGELTSAASYADYMQLAYRYTFGVNRLQASLTTGDAITSWDVGRAHPAFMENISDFAIEFAADIDDDPSISQPDPANKPWVIDGTPDIDATTGEIKWYGHFENNPGSPTTYDPSKPLVYLPSSPYAPYDDGSGGLQDADGSVLAPPTSSGTANTASFVWMNDNTATPPFVDWPHLIRIRYRIHDKNGRYRGTDPTSLEPINGRWFEIIVPVNRN